MTRALCLALALAGCASKSEVIVVVDTDAPVPASADAVFDPARPPALVDRLRVTSILDGVAEDELIHEFEIDEGQLVAGSVSFGVRPESSAQTLSVRLMLYRGDAAATGDPPPLARLSTTVRIPSVGMNEVRRIAVQLRMEDVGLAIGDPDPIDAVEEPNPRPASLVGSWSGAHAVPCSGARPAGTVCVPGGAYWFGDPALRVLENGTTDPFERLVVVSPFFIDAHELTVGEYRPFNILPGPLPQAAGNPSDDLQALCTYTASPGPNEDKPLTCFTSGLAELVCSKRKGMLPTEAQYERAASSGRENPYPWGRDDPKCGDAVFGVGGGEASGMLGRTNGSCRDSTQPIGIEAIGSGARDRLALDGGVLVDLAGNVSELARDRYSALTEAYWSQPGVLVDPVADQPTKIAGAERSVSRGGYWGGDALTMRAAVRINTGDVAGATVGFRCVFPATPAL